MAQLFRFRVLNSRLVLFFALICTPLANVSGQDNPDAVETILTNARIYTVNARQPWAEALAIRGGKIVAVGTKKEMASYRGPFTKTIDAKQHLVLPGFVDCHIHFMEGSLGLTHVDLNDAGTVAEIQKRVKEYAAAHPDEPWITGMGWTYPTFKPSGLPDKKFLDEVVPDRPVYLSAFDGHSSWANSKALQLAGITKDTPDPTNGKIVRDEIGEATGALKEAAGDLVSKLMPKPAREERLAALRLGMHEANKYGLVRVHSAGGDFEYLDLYDQLRKDGQLSVRFYVAYFLDPPGLSADAIDSVEHARDTYHDAWISGGAVKTMLDGVVEAHTAAMLSPYSDDPSLSGKLFWDPAKYTQAVDELDRRGFQIFTHAIGDRGVRTALDAYQDAQKKNHSHDPRPRIEHIETISAPDIKRFGKIGVIASFQPLHSYPDEDTLSIWARNAGPERAQRAWAWKSIQKEGGRLAFGSDWPVVTLNPWPGVQTAVTRQTRDGKPDAGFVPQQRLGLEDAIKGYTLDAAVAGRREETEGSLEPGKLADLIIVSEDLFKMKSSDISKEEVLATMVGGKVVYESPKWKSSQTKEEQ
jgi:predicted amidohydrolase YtcJ